MTARRYLPRSTEELIRWYERFISPVSLIAGILMDNFVLLRRVDLWQSNAILITYLTVAAVGIAAINLIETGRLPQRERFRTFITKAAPFIPVVVQFALGGLLSGFVSLYGRSAGFSASWIFVGVVALLLIGNERFHKLYVRFVFQIGVYYFVLFSFLIFFLPVLFKSIGHAMFIASGLVSLAVVAGLLWIMHRLVPELERRERTRVAWVITVIFLAINSLYFFNLIPPLPLALKQVGVYHEVTRVGDTYTLEGEREPWYAAFLTPTYHEAPGEGVYVFTSIFAPSGLSVPVLHEWQYYSTDLGQWVTVSTVTFPINGGRDGGYRGYSFKASPAPGAWRVNVYTEYGQLIGRIRFNVVAASSTPPLVETTQ